MTCKPTILDKRLGTYLHLRRFLQPHMPLPTPACNVEPMYPHCLFKGGGRGEGTARHL